jgi:hypothetical protein
MSDYRLVTSFIEQLVITINSSAIAISHPLKFTTKKKLHGLSLRVNYTDQATAACRRSDCQLLRIEGATWSA